MNREALTLVISAILLGSTVIAVAFAVARTMDRQPAPFDFTRATDRELLECYRNGGWPLALPELQRRAANYTPEESTNLAFEILAAGFQVEPITGIYTSFFDDSAVLLPKPLADWVRIEGPRRRQDFADTITKFTSDQERLADTKLPVDVATLEELHRAIRKSKHYRLFWGVSPGCGMEDRLGPILITRIRRILDSGVPGGAEALKRLDVNP